jgi:hypothetical protein
VALQRLDIRTARFDRLSGSVLIDARNCVVEISLEALETLQGRALSPDEAVRKVIAEVKLFTRLATSLPADDGKIHITTALLMSDGMYSQDKGS